MRVKILIITLLFSNLLFSQNDSFPQYPNPVKIPISLSATFAELRTNAFHAGVDILLQNPHLKKIGLAYACQEVEAVPTEENDIPLDMVITENGVIRF